ncbi:hypothetical protein [Flavihumibacter sp. ZG627]|uniref:hypothetical protein n=1 Tax=Flavihumibacter sp. ZG627 TaxID=1463156 RepID=UPI0012E04D69|nr:hypothetical protein [Flavihumibacter sp. ZG627]
MNILQNGGDLTIIDAFDIATSTLSPTSSVSGSITMAGMNSIVDYNPFDFRNQKLKYLGGGKNLMEASLHISFNVFGEGFKFTIGAMGGTNATANMFTYIVTGNAGAAAQGVAADKN